MGRAAGISQQMPARPTLIAEQFTAVQRLQVLPHGEEKKKEEEENGKKKKRKKSRRRRQSHRGKQTEEGNEAACEKFPCELGALDGSICER